MSKVLMPLLTIATIALMLIPGPNIAVLGVTIGLHALIGVGLGLAGAALTAATAPKPKANQANVSRLQVTLDPTAPRKISFGITALATDMQYGAYTGTNQDHYDQIVCVAAHQVQSIDEIWFDNKQAWTSSGGVTSAYSGYLSVDVRTVGTRANGIGIDATWTTNSTLTGCAYLHLRYKLTGNSSSATSPFSSSIPTRFTVRGHGALVYDSRLDSTVAGGSGPQRASDQTTWAWSDSASRNPALQLLFYLLGWRIQNPSTGAWKLSVGRGIPASRLDLPSFMTAANVCDETVTLAAGGTEPRYRSDGVFSEGDDPSTALSNLLASMNATLRDAGGKIALVCYTNDLGSPAASFTEADILGNESWEQSPPFNQIFNIVRGRYTNPSNTTLYQLSDFPEISLASVDGIDRIDSVDFSNVQSPPQAQRLAKQRLQRSQYQGKYTADFGARAWQVSLGQVVQLSHASLGWANKLFRVTGQGISANGVTKMVLVEENAAIYAWSAEDSAAVTPGAPTVYDPANDPIVLGIGAAATTATWPGVSDPAGTKPADNAGTSGHFYSIGSQAVTVGPGNQMTRLAAGDFLFQSVVRGELQLGPCFASAAIRQSADWTIIGLSTSAAAVAQNLHQAFLQYNYGAGLLFIDVEGVTVISGASIGAGITGDLYLGYDGARYIYGVGASYSISFAAASATYQFNPKYTTHSPGTISNLQYGPYSMLPRAGATLQSSSGTVQSDAQTFNSFNTLTVGGTFSNGSGATYNLTLGGLEGSFSTKLDNQNVKLTAGGTLSFDGGTTATPGVTGRIIANDQIGASGGKLTNVGAGAAAIYSDNAYVTISTGKLSRDGGATTLAQTIDNSLVSATAAGVVSNGAGGSYPITALDFVNIAGSTKPANNATADIAPISIGSPAVTIGPGNSFTSPGGGFGPTARSPSIKGGMFAEMDTAGSNPCLMALDDDATSTDDAHLLFRCTYVASSGTYDVQQNGTTLSSGTGPTGAAKFRLTYDEVGLRAWADGTQLGATVAASAGLTLWPKWIGYAAGTFTGLKSGPFTTNYAGSLFYSGGTDTLQSLKPAEAGAEVTTGKSVDILADGATYARVKAAELSAGVPKLAVAGSGKKLGDARNMPNVIAQNLGYKITVAPTYSAAAGSPATATISMGAFTLTNGGATVSYSASSVGVSGTGGTIITYFLYFDDPTNAGGSQTLHATTTGLDIYSADGRVFVGQIDVTYPTSGTGTGTGGGGGGGGAGGNCVTEETWLSIGKRAGAVVVGDMLDVADPRDLRLRKGAVSYAEQALVECVRITTTEGSELECSTTAPIATADGEAVVASELLGHSVLIRADGRWQGELVADVEPLGRRLVRHITCEDTFFLAGNARGRFFLHHNLKVDP